MTAPLFEPVRRARIESLNIAFEEYAHTATGARHFHLDAEDDNNAFLVAFLTVPRDSTGISPTSSSTPRSAGAGASRSGTPSS